MGDKKVRLMSFVVSVCCPEKKVMFLGKAVVHYAPFKQQ
jgi:hypothetical protein